MTVPIQRLNQEADQNANPQARQVIMESRIRAMAGASLDAKRGFFDHSTPNVAEAAQWIVAAMRAGGKLLIFGNGGSAADAQHIAAELAFKMGRERRALPAIA